MKKLKLTKVIASALVAVSVLVLSPIGASGEWRQTSSGEWWYADQYGGWLIDWHLIDKKFYYFYGENGLMAHDTTIHTQVGDFTLGSDGAWTHPAFNYSGIYNVPPLTATVYNFDFKKGQINKYKENAKEIIIPGEIEGVKVTRIASTAFNNNPNMASVIIPDSVTYIGDSAFRNCGGLEKVVVPNSVLSVGTYLFNESTHVKIYVKSERVKKLLVNAYVPESNIIVTENNNENDKGNTNISVVDNAASDTDFYFDKTNGKILRYTGTSATLVIPNSIDGVTVKSIDNFAFNHCSTLTDVKIPNGVTSIGNYAFDGCTSLKNITIPSSVKSIGNTAFSDCSNLTSVTIPEGVTSIEACTFWGCKSLKEITIPNSVKTIDWGAFQGCSSLTNINANEEIVEEVKEQIK